MPAVASSVPSVDSHLPVRRKLSRTVRVSEVPIHTTLPRQLAERLFSLADLDSSTVAGITRQAIASYLRSRKTQGATGAATGDR
jgi:hypothetical protein